MSTHVIGIDVGTTSLKAIAIDSSGRVAGSASEAYPLSTPHPQWSEQDPDAWWCAAGLCVRRLLNDGPLDADDIACVGLTGQMHGLVLLDVDGLVLRPAILWNDQRTAAECAEIHDRVGHARVIAITGKPVVTGFTAPKLLWVRTHEPDVYDRIARVLLPKDYVRYRLSGASSMDVADASGVSLLDLTTRDWSSEILEALDVPRAWLPDVAEGPVVTTRANDDGARHTGLRPGTPIVAGAGDQAAEAIGCGIVATGDVSVAIGTSGVVFATRDEPPCDPSGLVHGFCHAVPDLWHVMGVMLSAGGSLRWFRDALAQDAVARAKTTNRDPYDVIGDDVRAIPPGSEGLFFMPYLTGERTPHPDPKARGAFVGLTVRHDVRHMGRAVMEGVAFGLRDALELVTAGSVRPDCVRLSGGGARGGPWRQIIADVLGTRIETLEVSEGAAFGAAILATVGAGFYADVAAACDACVRTGGVTEPGDDRRVYDEAYGVFRGLYPALAPTFERL